MALSLSLSQHSKLSRLDPNLKLITHDSKIWLHQVDREEIKDKEWVDLKQLEINNSLIDQDKVWTSQIRCKTKGLHNLHNPSDNLGQPCQIKTGQKFHRHLLFNRECLLNNHKTIWVLLKWAKDHLSSSLIKWIIKVNPLRDLSQDRANCLLMIVLLLIWIQ